MGPGIKEGPWNKLGVIPSGTPGVPGVAPPEEETPTDSSEHRLAPVCSKRNLMNDNMTSIKAKKDLHQFLNRY